MTDFSHGEGREVWSGKGDFELESGEIFDTLKVKSWNKKLAKSLFLLWAFVLVPLIFYALVGGQAKDAWAGAIIISLCCGGFFAFLAPAYVERFQFRDKGISWSSSGKGAPQHWTWRSIRFVEDKLDRVELTLQTGQRVGCAFHGSDKARARVLDEVQGRRNKMESEYRGTGLGNACSACGRETDSSGECACEGQNFAEMSPHERYNPQTENQIERSPLPTALIHWLQGVKTSLDIEYTGYRVSLMVEGGEKSKAPSPFVYLGGTIFGAGFLGCFLAEAQFESLPLNYDLCLGITAVGFFILFFSLMKAHDTACVRLTSNGWLLARFSKGLGAPTSERRLPWDEAKSFALDDDTLVLIATDETRHALVQGEDQELLEKARDYLNELNQQVKSVERA